MKFSGRPLVLVILDGWGLKRGVDGDALSSAEVKNFDRIWDKYPHTQLSASGADVGLPEGQMGDSEVGHMNIGAGRIMYQEFTRISNAIQEGDFFTNEVFLTAMQKAKRNNTALHLCGLCSDGGIHSHISHLFALLRLASLNGLEKVFVHCFTDGRDTSPTSAVKYIEKLENFMAELGIGQIASVIGRFYAMDRDKRWDRVAKAYKAMVYGEGERFLSAKEAIEASYAKGVTDEFIEPTIIIDKEGNFPGAIKSGDSMIFYNYRSDRAREITQSFCNKNFEFFSRGENSPQVHYVCMTKYEESLQVPIAYPPQIPANTLGKVIAHNGMRQLRIAETEKYAHVTFFFNGGVERMEVGEDRVMIPSPNVPTYDLKPEMSCLAVTRAVLDRIASNIYDLIVLNFANPDMLGHTGCFDATVKALNIVDECLGEVEKAIKAVGGTLIVTADHGNVECMLAENGKPMTAHTTSKVPFILVDDKLKHLRLREGELDDIAPTILQLMDIKQPAEMTGETLISGGLQQFDQLEFRF
ncbi:MAG: 2,3-bisphosphoglycerate-independent phosphoglycerate mutase [Bacillota bacterium]|jgi:2,3-bisphosphoglycerate-independent phosphoglycerate mutase